jgi:hypothetical protein
MGGSPTPLMARTSDTIRTIGLLNRTAKPIVFLARPGLGIPPTLTDQSRTTSPLGVSAIVVDTRDFDRGTRVGDAAQGGAAVPAIGLGEKQLGQESVVDPEYGWYLHRGDDCWAREF